MVGCKLLFHCDDWSRGCLEVLNDCRLSTWLGVKHNSAEAMCRASWSRAVPSTVRTDWTALRRMLEAHYGVVFKSP